MKLSTKKIFSIMLMFTLVVSQLSIVTAAESDIEGHWAQASVEKWLDLGLVNGYPDGTFKPNQDITRAEFVTLLDNVFGFQRVDAEAYSDVDDDAYYAEAVYAASAAGVITGYNGRFRPNDSITREEAATVVARAYQLSEPAGIDYLDYKDAIAVSPWAEAAIQALVEDGYMAGVGHNTLAPAAKITRASALTLIGNVFGTYVATEGEFTGVVDGNLFIASQDVVIKDAVVNGSIFVAPSVGEGDVTIDGTTIDGTLVAMGGGENSIKLNNTSVKKLIVAKVGGKVRVYAEGTTQVDEVALHSGAKLEEGSGTGSKFGKVELLEINPGEELILEGNFDEVVFQTKVEKVSVLNGTVGKMEFTGDSDDTKVELSRGSVITNLVVKSRVDVSGEGKIVKATVEKSDSNIDVDVDTVDVQGNDVTVNVNGKEVDEDTDTPSGNGGGSNGGGSSSGSSTRRLSVVIDNQDSDLYDEAFNIEGDRSKTIDYIGLRVMQKVMDNFDTYYSEYDAKGSNVLAALLFGGVDVFQYVTQDDLNQTVHFKGFDISTNYPNGDKKVLTKNVLQYVYNQMNTGTSVSDYEADMKLIASKVALGDITYKSEPFVSISVKSVVGTAKTEIASYSEGGDKVLFVDTMFDTLSNINMSTTATYEITLVRKENGQNKTQIGTIALTSR